MKQIILLLSVIFFLGCGEELIVKFPQQGKLKDLTEVQESMILLPLSFKGTQLKELVESKMPSGLIHQESRRVSNTTRYSYQVLRNKPISFKPSGNEFKFNIPLTINASGSYTACAGFWRDRDCCSTPNPFGDGCATPGVRTTENGNTTVEIMAELIVGFNMKPDYTLDVNSSFNAVLNNNPHLSFDLIGNLIRFNISIRDEIEPELRNYSAEIDREIKKYINSELSKINLKEEVGKLWPQFQEPLSIAEGELFINNDPQKVYFNNLNSANDMINLSFGISSKVSVSDVPIKGSTPMGDLIIDQKKQGGFNISLPVTGSFETLTDLLDEEYAGQVYSEGDNEFEIDEIGLRGIILESNKAGILIDIEFEVTKGIAKSTYGSLYITAVPAYNKEGKMIYLQDFKLTPDTNSALIDKGLNWMANKKYYKQIIESATYDFSQDYNEIYDKAKVTISEISLDGLTIRGTLDYLDFQGFHIDDENLVLLFGAKGELKTDPFDLSTIEIPD